MLDTQRCYVLVLVHCHLAPNHARTWAYRLEGEKGRGMTSVVIGRNGGAGIVRDNGCVLIDA